MAVERFKNKMCGQGVTRRENLVKNRNVMEKLDQVF